MLKCWISIEFPQKLMGSGTFLWKLMVLAEPPEIPIWIGISLEKKLIIQRLIYFYNFTGNSEDANAASTASTGSTAMEEGSKSDTDADSTSATISAPEKNSTVDSEPWFYICPTN